MALGFGGDIITNGLVFNLDFINKRCYTSGNGGKNLVNQYPFTGVSSLSYTDGYMSFFANSIWIDSGTYLPGLTGDFTLDFYARPGSTQNTYADIFGNHADGYKGMVIQQNANQTNVYTFYMGTGSTWINPAGANFTLTANVWSHVILIRSGSNFYSYINGALYGSASGVSTSSILPNSSRNLMIGNGWQNGNSRVFRGDIAFFKIYNRAFSSSDILKSYNFIKGRYGL